ncbi:MAG: aminoacyl-tRNA hydrolase [Candidatus Melainabacteria bacterium GWF2_37_15]|nr:MAG: aminoacyl-tRNA hydrolase [Candidatus Melainabacteria bacterium GWF2_37_15]
MLLIAGLGNPGQKYKGTRHNIGFMITGNLAEKHGIIGSFSSKFNAIVGKGKIKDTEVLIVQPQTYMNLSGQAISAVLNWYRLDISNLFVVFDDVTLDFGKMRFRPSGTAGSHNGIKSIIERCGSENFSRLKVGIGPNPGEHLWASYVLQPFSAQEKEHLPKITDVCTEAVEYYLENGMAFASNKYNGLNILEEVGQKDN